MESNKRKTAMTELIEYVELQYGSISETAKEEYLLKEKEQMQEFFRLGAFLHDIRKDLKYIYEGFTTYFKLTFLD
jgi:phosphoenolpyruvate carboxylase